VVRMPALDVTIKRVGGVCVLSVRGELDIATTPALIEQAAPALQVPAERLVVDLTGLAFIDCCGVRALSELTCAAPPGCPVLVRGVNSRVRKVLDILAVPLERHGAVDLDQGTWLILESQVLRSWSQRTRAKRSELVARSRHNRARTAALSGPAWFAAQWPRLARRRPGPGNGC
jgi:anti-sigma B factor antagonist